MDTCKRYFFIIFNLLYMILGIVLLLFAVWLQYGSPIHEVSDLMKASKFLTYLTVGVGGLLAVIGLFGIFGTVYHNKCLLTMYVGAVTAFLLAEIGIATFALVVYYQVGSSYGITEEVWNDSVGDEIKDSFHKRFNCCGFNNATDYNNADTDRVEAPCSCCSASSTCSSDLDDFCDYDKDPTLEAKDGCLSAGLEWISSNIYIIAGIAAAIVLFEVCQVVVSCLLIKDLNMANKTRPARRSPPSSSGSSGGSHYTNTAFQHDDK